MKAAPRTVALTLIATILTGPMSVQSQPDRPAQPSDIRSFVRQIYIEGVPYEQAIRFDANTAVPVLLSMLTDPNEEDYWPNVVITLGMLGDERAVDPLIKFLEQDVPGAQLSRSHYVAKTGVLMAFGYLINKSGSQRALTYLRDSLKPDVWRQRGLSWLGPFNRDAEARDVQLTKMAILGLALSAHPAAAEALRSLQGPPQTEPERKLHARLSTAVAEALREHRIIATEGLVNYDRRKERGPTP
jgi:HEAT repeat protein